MPSLSGKRIILGVTGSIAAIKSPLIAAALAHEGASVTCVLTKSALQFTTEPELEIASDRSVISHIFPGSDQASSADLRGEKTWHVHLARGADAMIIAPCSASTIGMLRAGIYDNPVTLVAASLPRTTPLILVPAMDEEMWLQPAVQESLAWLKKNGAVVIGPVKGNLASGLVGMGRMTEPEDIVRNFIRLISDTTPHPNPLLQVGEGVLVGKKVLITGGPTFEPIDAVRFIGNRSSGKMAAAIAAEAKKMGAEVTLIMGPSQIETDGIANRYDVETAEEMLAVVQAQADDADIIIMSAAVADFTPEKKSEEKLKKGSSESMTLTLRKTPDILAEIAKSKRAGQFIVGFALEKGDEAASYAQKKLVEKNLDMIVLNNIADEGAGFGYDTNKITIFTKSGDRRDFPLMSKEQCAREILKGIGFGV